MGYHEIELKLPTDFDNLFLKNRIAKELSLTHFNYFISRKSLDARNKRNIHWLIRVGIESSQIKDGEKPGEEYPVFPDKFHGKGKKVVVGGCGPAGIFAALVFQSAGYKTTIIEKGGSVIKRIDEIEQFEKTGKLLKNSGYCFGEGGAGTFSDGKLTSRTKAISLEKNYIFKELIAAGAPEEIAYMTHPHLGSDNLKKIVPSLIKKFQSLGGRIFYETEVLSFDHKNGKVISVEVAGDKCGKIDGEIFVFAPGHSSYDFYKALIKSGVKFENKPFAIGFRVEHQREEVNVSQWGVKELPGIKAAEYRLTSKCNGDSVFTFCMCPGGKIVQASPKQGLSVVNGMSDYFRDGEFSNSAVVTPFKIEDISKRMVSTIESLEIIEDLERKFFEFNNSFNLPAMTISDIVNKRPGSPLPLKNSYSFNLINSDFRELLPEKIFVTLAEGLKVFSRKITCFENGVAAGFESKTSAPLKAVRTEKLSTPPFDNLFISGEGSGHAGGIISSASDGIKVALKAMRCL